MDKDINKQVDKIQWIGKDGLLIIAWFVVVFSILYAFVAHNDFLIQWGFPALLFVVTTLIFIDYCTRVGGFIKQSRKNADERKKRMDELEKMDNDSEKE